jgi:hypothetical protein
MQNNINNSTSNNTNYLNDDLEYISDYNSSEDIPIINNSFSNNSSYIDNFHRSYQISYADSISSDSSLILDYINNKNQYNSTNIENNEIYKRPNYIKYNIMKNTYFNKQKYQIVFNKIIFNIN